MANFYCEHCGARASSVASLTAQSCGRHPAGSGKGRHSLYQGAEKTRYTCKYCGTGGSNISALTVQVCNRHPNGTGKGRHIPAL